jgi:hypothetical protein
MVTVFSHLKMELNTMAHLKKTGWLTAKLANRSSLMPLKHFPWEKRVKPWNLMPKLMVRK